MDTIKTLLGLLWKVIIFAQQAILTMFAFVVLFLVILFMNFNKAEPIPTVPTGAALIIAPTGFVVEQTTPPNTTDFLLADYETPPRDTRLDDIITAISRAKEDDDISGIVLLTDGMAGGGPSKMHAIANALKDFKTGGKPIYSVSTSYNQGDYLLASVADRIFLNSGGNVILQGYGGNTPYYKSLLDMLKVDVNVFRVGTFKSAVEPYIRDDMSEAAKTANRDFLSVLWDAYETSVVTERGLQNKALTSTANNFLDILKQSNGNFATMAKNQNLVDEIASRSEWRKTLIEEFGANIFNNSFKQIHFMDYLNATDADFYQSSSNEIALIVVQGEIVMGEADNSVAAAETIVRQIRRARNNTRTKAIVLRVDSPGGSAFGSELIRQELVAAQNQGIPVVASFSTYAASGGYWISATANKIIASPTTITGSIGIFGIIPTFERTLDTIGIHTDGVGTTDIATAFDVTKDLSPIAKGMFQQTVENGYAEFLNLVANGRGMTVDAVSKIAEGRVWAGTTAKNLGLVDALGEFEDAVNAAAELATIENYTVVEYGMEVSEFTQFLESLFRSYQAKSTTKIDSITPLSPFMKMAEKLRKDAMVLTRLNDPNGRYLLCDVCTVQ